MAREVWIKEILRSVDNRDTDAFLTFLTDDVLFRFGNAEPVNGKGALGDALRGFFGSIYALRHDVLETLEQHDAVVCHGEVTYTRKDSSTLTVPFANVFKLEGELIKDYLIYIDASGL
jgi:ketosteroid isomerase-like protein